MSNTSKMDSIEVYKMFEALSDKFDKQADKPVESVQIDLSAVDTMTERFENMIEEVRKPVIVKQQYHHTIDIGSSKIFLSLIIMALMIIGLSYVVGEQRRSISQYKENDLKYRYVKMQGQINEENIHYLEQQFKYNDSIKIIRKQVEKYEELVKEQAEKVERIKENKEQSMMIQKEIDRLKHTHK